MPLFSSSPLPERGDDTSPPPPKQEGGGGEVLAARKGLEKVINLIMVKLERRISLIKEKIITTKLIMI